MKNFFIAFISSILVISLMYILSMVSYNLFHMTIEVSMLLIGVVIFTSAMMSQKLNYNKFTEIVGPGILISSVILFLHALTYGGMNVISGYDANLPTQLWIIANFILALSFVGGAFHIGRAFHTKYIIFTVITLGVFFVFMAFSGSFPDSYIVGSGLTLFKKIAEVVIVFLYLLSLYVVYIKRNMFENNFFKFIGLVIIFLIIGELLFTIYINVDDLTNFLGHIFKLFAFVGFAWIIRALSINEPIKDLFRDLENEIVKFQESEKVLQISEKRYRELVNNLEAGVIVHAPDTSVIMNNQKACDLLGLTDEMIKGRKVYDSGWHFLNQHMQTLPIEEYPVNLVLSSKQEIKNIILGVFNPTNNEIKWLSVNGTPYIDNEGEIEEVIISFFNITELKENEDDLTHLSYHDSLTGLHNRRYYEENLIKLDTPDNYPLTIVMSDVNGLKLINDAFGHVAGDQLLIAASKVISDACRESDLVARIGGDEFVIVMPNTTKVEAEEIIKNINDSAKAIAIQSIGLSISFGLDTKNKFTENIQEIFRNAEDLMYRVKLIEIPSMRSEAIDTILQTLNEKDENSKIHCSNVSTISEKLAIACGMNPQEVEEVKTAGLLHDIGKIIISTELITKDGPFTKEEYEIMKGHSEIGFRILNSTHNMRGISNIVLSHHEWWNGEGYPRGIKEDFIPVQSRIIAVADAFDAMTKPRTYRNVFTHKEAKEEIIRCSGTQFDPMLVKVFIDNFEHIME